MNKNEMLKLKRKVEKYKKLEEKVWDIYRILDSLEHVRNKVEINLLFRFSTSDLNFVIDSNSKLGKVIFNALKEEKERLQKEMEEL